MLWIEPDLPLQLKEEEMVKDVVYYIVILQGKQQSRKAEILKHAMNKQSKDFPKVIRKVDKDLRRLFGLRLVGLKNGPEGQSNPVKCNLLEANSFLTVSVFRQHVIALTTPDQTFLTDLPKAALLLILTCSFMNERALDEDYIWAFLEKMEIAAPLCKKKEDFKRFLKTNYVDPLYLTKTETKHEDNVVYHYEWGVRAELEFSKYALLKWVSQSIGKRPNEFVNIIAKISPDEIQAIDEEDMRRMKDPESASANDTVSGEGTGNDISQLNESVNNTSTRKRNSDAESSENSEDQD